MYAPLPLYPVEMITTCSVHERQLAQTSFPHPRPRDGQGGENSRVGEHGRNKTLVVSNDMLLSDDLNIDYHTIRLSIQLNAPAPPQSRDN